MIIEKKMYYDIMIILKTLRMLPYTFKMTYDIEKQNLYKEIITFDKN